jgi:hypothetical protein
MKGYEINALALMNQWTQAGTNGFVYNFSVDATDLLKSPWEAGEDAVDAFKTSTETKMSEVVSNIRTNVVSATDELNKIKALYAEINDTDIKPPTTGGGGGGGGGGGESEKMYYVVATLNASGQTFSSGSVRANSEKIAKERAKEIVIQRAYDYYKSNGYDDLQIEKFYKGWNSRIKYGVHSYAKGTTGIARDQFAITDEPQFGDELVLVPGKDGNLSFMRKGTGVVPADMTQKLFELAQIPTSDLMNKNLTAIVPNITKNDFKNEFNFESLVHVDRVDSDTLPKLEKMVDKKIDDFSKALNYSLKRFAR